MNKNIISELHIDKLKNHLMDYIRYWSQIYPNKKFQCFNKDAHRHGDRDPSAAIVPQSNDRYWTCFSCGAKGDIFKAVQYSKGITSFRDQVHFLSEKFSLSLPEGEGATSHRGQTANDTTHKRSSIANYYYQNEDSQTVFRVDRKEWYVHGKKMKTFSFFRKTTSGWSPGLRGMKRYLYRLPEALKAIKESQLIFFVEGEKCVRQIEILGLVGTTAPGGANGWKAYEKDYLPSLRGARLIILPDNDEPGNIYGREIYKASKTVTSTVWKLELPGLQHKGDIVDWVAAGGTREKLLELVEKVQAETTVSDTNSALDEVSIDAYSETAGAALAADTSKRSYPVFEENNAYYKYVKVIKQALTNFILEPVYIVEGDSQKQMLAKVIGENGKTIEKLFHAEDFDDIVPFRKALNSFDYFYTGRAEELQYIRLLSSQKDCLRKLGVKYIGFHELQNQWHFVSEDGAVNAFLQPAEDVVLLDGYAELSSSILKFDLISKAEIQVIAPALFSFNTLPVTATLLGYLAGLFLKGKLQSLNMKYNHLLIEGQSGSGKSQTLENVVAPLLGMHTKLLNASDCTLFALNRALSSSNFVPLVLDEYKPLKIGKAKVDLISNLLRNAYDGHKSIKGVQNLSKNREFEARASIILCGEVGIGETANIERSLKLILSTAHHTAERRGHMETLKQNSEYLTKLGKSLLQQALAMEPSRLQALHTGILTKLIGKDLQNERVKASIANCILGLGLLKNVFDALELDIEACTGIKVNEMIQAVKEAAHKDLLEEGTGSISVLEGSLEIMNRMAANGVLLRGTDYDAVLDNDNDFVLRLNYTCFYDRFLKYCRDHNLEDEILPLRSFKRQLQKAVFCKCYNKPTNFYVHLGDPKEKKTFRAAVLHTKMLQEKRLEIDYLLDNHLEDSIK